MQASGTRRCCECSSLAVWWWSLSLPSTSAFLTLGHPRVSPVDRVVSNRRHATAPALRTGRRALLLLIVAP